MQVPLRVEQAKSFSHVRYLSARGALQPSWCARPRHNTAVCALGFPATVFQAIRGIMGAKDDFQVSTDQKWWTTDTVAIVTGGRSMQPSACDIACVSTGFHLKFSMHTPDGF